jgi:nucleoside-diphosphate-sugar epimerase
MGHELVFRLLAAGHRVSLFNRGRHEDPFRDRVERLRGDRTTAYFADRLRGRSFDAAVDFAAFTGDDARSVVQALADRLGHYVAISTGQVYLVRRDAPRPSREEDYDGPLLPEPETAFDKREWDYGMGKRAMEDVFAEAFRERRFPATCLRLPMVNGERDHLRRLEGYLWRLLDGGPLLMPEGGTHRVRHVYAGSVVRAIVALLGDARAFGRAYNLAQDETPTLREMLSVLAELLGARPRFVGVTDLQLAEAKLERLRVSPFSGRWMSFLDPGRAKRELGFRHEPLVSYLGRIVASFLAHPPEDRPPAGGDREREITLGSTLE